MRRHFLTILLLMAVIVDGHAVSDLLSANIAVSDRSEKSLASSASEALASILVKVSGDETILDNAVAAAAISDARSSVSLYSYEGSGEATTLFVQFDDSVVKDILRRSGATFWGESRPPVLLWLVIDESYARRFATISEDGEIMNRLAADFAGRGVRLRFPLHDLEDAANLSVNMVWQKVAPRILAASERYGTQHILVGRWVPLSNGQIIADWLYLDGANTLGAQRQSTELTQITGDIVDTVVDAMAARYAVKLGFAETQSALRVVIDGVVTLDDYRNVMAQIAGIEVLDRVQISAINGDRLELTVAGVPDAASLARLLPNRARLTLVSVADASTLLLSWGQR